ncbi:TlpA family protein disulfide reductase [Natronobiforma cellulositropha]|uniref:TlpA family protein disulfide reductase n=1 Tax=Natronobiforma cellulositropha TaxID=1679076 RepID=UPI0021D5C1C8|nr:TlpA disulfide reductase family protein [Natronobiforma cellulositropha]
MSFRPSRRRLLARGSSLCLLATIAGCLSPGDASSDDGGAERPTGGTTAAGSPEDASDGEPSTGETPDGGTSGGVTPDGDTANDGTTDRTPASDEPTETDPEAASSTEGAATEQSIRLPGVDAPGSSGGLVSLTPPADVVVLNFFATWCPPCIPEMDNIRPLRDTYSEDEVFIASITQEGDTDAITAFWETHDGAWPVLLDPGARASYTYRVTTIPTILVLDSSGDERHRHTGLVGEDTLRASVEDVLGRGED